MPDDLTAEEESALLEVAKAILVGGWENIAEAHLEALTKKGYLQRQPTSEGEKISILERGIDLITRE